MREARDQEEAPPDELPDVGIHEAEDGSRTLAVEVEIDAPLGEVWQALSEAEGLRRWFPLDARLEPGEGGSIWLSWGPGCEGQAPITAWEPERRLGWDEGAAKVDFTLKEQDGGPVRVRLVQSGFAGEGWEGQLDAMRRGWTYFMFNLRHYLEQHRGSERRLVWRRRPGGAAREEVWQRLLGGDGLGTEAPDGDLEPGLISLVLAGRHPGIVVMAERPHVFAIVLDDLDQALLFVELEMGGDGWHCGLWLSTWGLSEAQVEELDRDMDRLAERVLGPAS